MRACCPYSLLKGLNSKPLRAGCPQPRGPQTSLPQAPKAGITTALYPVAKPTLEATGPHKGGQHREEGSTGKRDSHYSQLGSSAWGCGCAKYLPLVPEKGLPSCWSDSCPHREHKSFPPGQVQISPPIYTQLLAIAAPSATVSLSTLIYGNHKVVCNPLEFLFHEAMVLEGRERPWHPKGREM